MNSRLQAGKTKAQSDSPDMNKILMTIIITAAVTATISAIGANSLSLASHAAQFAHPAQEEATMTLKETMGRLGASVDNLNDSVTELRVEVRNLKEKGG